MPTLADRGVELAWSERGEGLPVLLVHETATSAAVWEPLAERLARDARAIAYDRRGWGGSSAPDSYRRTTVEEQSEDAAALLRSVADGPAVVCGAGLGAVIALDLLIREPEALTGAVLIEPPLLQLLPPATEALSDDRRRLEVAASAGEDVIGLYLSGGLPALGPGITRLPDELTRAGREHPASLVAELGIAAGWRTPLPRLAGAEWPSAIVTSSSTPPLIRAASSALAGRLAGAAAHELDSGETPPHLGAPGEVAAIALELA
jgi:pimeloyl-ACP methyl ester carboxylesterase